MCEGMAGEVREDLCVGSIVVYVFEKGVRYVYKGVRE